jgi:hypothetical protein
MWQRTMSPLAKQLKRAECAAMLVRVLRGVFESELVVSFVHFTMGMDIGGANEIEAAQYAILPNLRMVLLTGAEAQLQLALESQNAQTPSSPQTFAEQVDDVLRVLQQCAPPCQQEQGDTAGEHESNGDSQAADAGVEYLVSLAKYLDTLGLSRHATRLAFVALSRLNADDNNDTTNNSSNSARYAIASLNMRSVLWANIFAFSTRGADPDYRLALSAIVAQTDTNKRAQFLRQLIVQLLDREQYECILSLPLSRDADLHANALDLIKQRAQYTPPRYALPDTLSPTPVAFNGARLAVAQSTPASCYHLWFAMCMHVGAFVDAAEAMLRLARHHERAFAPLLQQQQQQQQQRSVRDGHLATVARARAQALSASVMALQLVAPHDAVLVLGSSGGGGGGAAHDHAPSRDGGVTTTLIHAMGVADVQREFVLADALARLTEAGEIPRIWTCTCRQDTLVVVRQLLDVELVEVAAGLCSSEKLDLEPFTGDEHDGASASGGGSGGVADDGGGVLVTLTDMCVNSGEEEGVHWDLLRSLLERFDKTTAGMSVSRSMTDENSMDDGDDALFIDLPIFRYHAVVLERLLMRRASAGSHSHSHLTNNNDGSDSKLVPLWLLRSFKHWARFSRRHTPNENAFAAGSAHPALCAKLMLKFGLVEDACELVAEMLPMYDDVKDSVGVVVEPPWIPTALIDQLIGACKAVEREYRYHDSSASGKTGHARVRAVVAARKALEARTRMFFTWVVEQQHFRNASYLGNMAGA